MLKMINKTSCWLSAVFVDFQFTPWHKTEVHFNRLVQQCPPCLETVITPVQFLRSFFRGCLDELANMIARLHEVTISIRSLASCDADTFTYPPLSFRPNVVMRTPILQTLGTSTVQKCNTCYENSTVASSCLIYPREMFDRLTRRERCTRCDPKAEVVFFLLFACLFFSLLLFFFILFNVIVKQWEAKTRGLCGVGQSTVTKITRGALLITLMIITIREITKDTLK